MNEAGRPGREHGGGGLPTERMSSDSWPALHGRPVLRRTIAMGLVLFVAVSAALVVRGVNALTLGRGAIETDRDRAELLAGLHPSQHPGAGRYYVPVGAVYTRTADGVPVAYLHYRLGGGQDVGLGDFLRTYDLPAPGPSAPLPPDLAAALGGDEPAEAPELPDTHGAPTPAPTPSGTTPAPAAGSAPTDAGSPTEPAVEVAPSSPPPPPPPSASSPSCSPRPTGPADPVGPADSAGPPDPADPVDSADRPGPAEAAESAGPTEEAAPGGLQPGARAEDEPPAPTPTPVVTPTPTPEPTRSTSGRRIYVAATSGGLPGAADIYVRATG
ncbi:hypothetical protein [Kitasatospora sp. NPDC050463]|uniref:hypothetical protein n=1 Tax=Kitasatospora sp. NPDC050463 TaxID=3155786 RepID=UPI00340B2D6B